MPEIKSFLTSILEQFEDTTLRVLIVAATLTLLAGLFSDIPYQWVEGASIYVAVLFIVSFASSCDHLKEKQYIKLHEEVFKQEVSVIRGQYGLS